MLAASEASLALSCLGIGRTTLRGLVAGLAQTGLTNFAL
jgi:hypothetical protein